MQAIHRRMSAFMLMAISVCVSAWSQSNDIVENSRHSLTEELLIQSRRNFVDWDHRGNQYPPLTLAVFTDLHGDRENLERYLQFCEHYRPYIDDRLQLGDLVGGEFADSTQFFMDTPGHETIQMVMGNHDTNANEKEAPGKSSAERWLYFAGKPAYDRYLRQAHDGFLGRPQTHQPEQAEEQGYCFYYTDYEAQHIRLVVLDCMQYSLPAQQRWWRETLEDARRKELAVLAAVHVPLDSVRPLGHFNSPDYPVIPESFSEGGETYLQAVDRFMEQGGEFIAWLSGHIHTDGCGTFVNHPSQLSLSFENASANDYWSDVSKIRGTSTQDSFNLLTIDHTQHLIKIVRVGNRSDRLLRSKQALVLDYKNKKVITQR